MASKAKTKAKVIKASNKKEMNDQMVDEIYRKVRDNKIIYDEEFHCKMIIRIMMNSGRFSDFCIQAMVGEEKFYKWVKDHPLFRECYSIGKVCAREKWEREGIELREHVSPPGTINHAFEHWRLIGWSRFGISKNSRIRLDLDPNLNPGQHYAELLKQASNGDFTAAEIKQLMEAINVGLNTHQVFELQKEIDQLKSDLELMRINSNVHNSVSDKTAQETD